LQFSQPTEGGGAVAQGTATIVSGVVTQINITNPGTGYSIGSTASIRFVGGDPVSPASTIIISSASIKAGFIGRLGQFVETQTAGNKSILNADFTQLNDLGYGIVVTNNGLSENVSVFTYYNQVAFYANNGGTLRSLNGANSYGNYALKAAGSDPNEVPSPVILNDDMVQSATVVSGVLGSINAVNTGGSTSLYIKGYNYVPYNQCNIEVDHSTATDIFGNILGTQVYTITTVSTVTDSIALSVVPGLVRLDLAGGSAFGISSGGIKAPIPTGTNITIRATSIFRVKGYNPSAFTRPSTVLQFNESTASIYHILSYDTTGMPQGDVKINSREDFNYVQLVTYDGIWPAPQPGTTSIKIQNIIDQRQVDRLLFSTGTSTTQMTFGWKSGVYKITSYTTATGANANSATITISPALINTLTNAASTSTGVRLLAGLRAFNLAAITARISTLRVSGHDLANVGAGSFQQSNYPNDIYGPPAGIVSSDKERIEVGKGRVFAITTDQSGNFRVGDFFAVNQDSGSLSIAGSISLTSIDGLKFKKGGAEIRLFSTDDTMVNAAGDSVPTEGAIVGYINHRLGLTAGGQAFSKIGSGYLDLTGIQNMAGTLLMNNNNINMSGSGSNGKILNLTTGTGQFDAINKSYVDIYENTKLSTSGTNYVDPFSGTADSAFGKMTGPLWLVDIPTYNTATWISTTPLVQAATKKYVDQIRQFNTLTDVVLTDAQDTDFVMFGSTSSLITYSTATGKPSWYPSRDVINVRSTTTGVPAIWRSDIAVARYANTLTLTIVENTITNSMIWTPVDSSNGIAQSKLNMNKAKSISSSTGVGTISQADLGLSVYHNQYFSVDAAGCVTLANTSSFMVITQTAKKVENPLSFSFGLSVRSGGSSIYNGTTSTTVDINATNTNVASTIVYRDSNKDFSANNITANLIGDVYATNGTSIVVDSGTNGLNATFTGNLTGNVTGHSSQLYDSANATGRTLSTGTTAWSVVQRDVNGNIWSSLFIGVATQARYADLAEAYVADAHYEPGTVLEFGGEHEVTLAEDSTRKIAGVVSAKPAYLMNSECQGDHVVVLALTGRVPVKVRGTIRKGDMMISAGGGYARPSTNPVLGSVLGKALENFDNGEGVIEIVVGRL
jgi:hypothetical protein